MSVSQEQQEQPPIDLNKIRNELLASLGNTTTSATNAFDMVANMLMNKQKETQTILSASMQKDSVIKTLNEKIEVLEAKLKQVTEAKQVAEAKLICEKSTIPETEKTPQIQTPEIKSPPKIKPTPKIVISPRKL